MQVADIFELTSIDQDYDADTFFPEVNFDEWELIKREDKEGKDVKNNINVKFSFLTYRKKK